MKKYLKVSRKAANFRSPSVTLKRRVLKLSNAKVLLFQQSTKENYCLKQGAHCLCLNTKNDFLKNNLHSLIKVLL